MKALHTTHRSLNWFPKHKLNQLRITTLCEILKKYEIKAILYIKWENWNISLYIISLIKMWWGNFVISSKVDYTCSFVIFFFFSCFYFCLKLLYEAIAKEISKESIKEISKKNAYNLFILFLCYAWKNVM